MFLPFILILLFRNQWSEYSLALISWLVRGCWCEALGAFTQVGVS